LAIVNSMTINMHVNEFLSYAYTYICLDTCPGVAEQIHMVILSLPF
jgi:hypothetical protein